MKRTFCDICGVEVKEDCMSVSNKIHWIKLITRIVGKTHDDLTLDLCKYHYILVLSFINELKKTKGEKNLTPLDVKMLDNYHIYDTQSPMKDLDLILSEARKPQQKAWICPKCGVLPDHMTRIISARERAKTSRSCKHCNSVVKWELKP